MYVGKGHSSSRAIGCLLLSIVAVYGVSFVLTSVRVGSGAGSFASEMPMTALKHVPADWPQLVQSEQKSWVGFTITKHFPGSAPDCRECNVAIWHMSAGWPLHCLESWWMQDFRDEGIDLSIVFRTRDKDLLRPASPKWKTMWDIGLNSPASIRESPSLAWFAIKPRLVPFVGNIVIYSLVFYATHWSWRVAVKQIAVRVRRSRKSCVTCGYPVASTGYVCPECGTTCEFGARVAE